MMLDSDDLLAPEYISTVSSVLNASPDCAAAYSDFQLFGDRNERLQFISYSDELCLISNGTCVLCDGLSSAAGRK
jgi:hypothetical protein